jgi:hypothetical protein
MSQPRPPDWPLDEPWPLPQGVRISDSIQTYPMTYILSDGRRIVGKLT